MGEAAQVVAGDCDGGADRISASSAGVDAPAEGKASPAPKTPLLLLCHRIPYPPNKGDKIRAFHLLRHLSQTYDVHLATFIDDPDDLVWRSDVESYCGSACFEHLDPGRATLYSLRGLLSGAALTLPYYASARLARWVKTTVAEHRIRHVIVYSSAMAQFLPAGVDFRRKVVDFVDIDSDKWLQYANRKPWPLSWIYRREGRCLLRYEAKLAEHFDAGLFVSEPEAAMFRRLVPSTAHKIGFYNNGVNAEYFAPGPEHGNPFEAGSQTLVFTGAMDYWPNVDAVIWFAREVFPTLRARFPALALCIVGGNPTADVRDLARQDGISVTGRVPDVRPYLNHALAAIAPMRIARGVQNKVLEGMAMGRPVLVSRLGLEGIRASHGDAVLLADTASDYELRVRELLDGHHEDLGRRARAFVQRHFNWDDNLPEVVALLGDEGALPRNELQHERGQV